MDRFVAVREGYKGILDTAEGRFAPFGPAAECERLERGAQELNSGMDDPDFLYWYSPEDYSIRIDGLPGLKRLLFF